MQDQHKKALDDVFADAAARQDRDTAQRTAYAAETHQFDERFRTLIKSVVHPTFKEFEDYVGAKGVPAFLDYVEPYETATDDIPPKYYCRFTFGKREGGFPDQRFLEVVGDPAKRSIVLQSQDPARGAARVVNGLDGSPVGVTVDALHLQLRNMLVMVLA